LDADKQLLCELGTLETSALAAETRVGCGAGLTKAPGALASGAGVCVS